MIRDFFFFVVTPDSSLKCCDNISGRHVKSWISAGDGFFGRRLGDIIGHEVGVMSEPSSYRKSGQIETNRNTF